MKKISPIPHWIILIISGIPAIAIFIWGIKAGERLVKALDPEAFGIVFGVSIALVVWYFIYKFITTTIEEKAYQKRDREMLKKKDDEDNPTT